MGKDFDYKRLHAKVEAPAIEKTLLTDFQNPSKRKKGDMGKEVRTSSSILLSVVAPLSMISPPSSARVTVSSSS